MLRRERMSKTSLFILPLKCCKNMTCHKNNPHQVTTRHETDEGGAEGCGSLVQAEEGEADTRDGHKKGCRRNDAEHLWTERPQHDRDDAGDEICRKCHVVGLQEAT